MEAWKLLEFEYAKRLRECSTADRRKLYEEAYTIVSALAAKRFTSNNPEDRTAGTSKNLVQVLAQICDKDDTVLEVGCGRGYTCTMLSPYVNSIVGTDVSNPALVEAKKVISSRGITNVKIKKVSGFDLINHFESKTFNAVVSIDVLEHLYLEDIREHLKQVFKILKPGGQYIMVMANRFLGPSDITKEEFPEAKKPLGFHLHESTYREMVKLMKEIGYKSLKSFIWSEDSDGQVASIRQLPVMYCVAAEILFEKIQRLHYLSSRLRYYLTIRLIAHKPVL